MLSKKHLSVLISVLRIIVGSVFIFSGYVKLMSIVHFELYIFSQNIFDFNISSVFARLVISFEIITGVLLICNFYFRTIYRFVIAMLLSFTVFLLFKFFVSPDENCNCFGNFIALNPIESIIKNIVLFILLFFIRNNISSQWRFKKWSTVLITVSIPVLIFVISLPDVIYNKIYKPSLGISGETLINISDTSLAYQTGKKILFFSSMHCKYCLMASQKLALMVEGEDVKNDIYFYFYDNEDELDAFWLEVGTSGFTHAFIPQEEFMEITEGRMPSIFFVNDGRIVQRHRYSTFDEDDIFGFLE